MKRYTVARARERLADVLNEADRSGAVVIERREVQYVITARRAPGRTAARRSAIESIDPAVVSGQWQWTTTATGMRFKRRRA